VSRPTLGDSIVILEILRESIRVKPREIAALKVVLEAAREHQDCRALDRRAAVEAARRLRAGGE
jgi:hypothetical protein